MDDVTFARNELYGDSGVAITGRVVATGVYRYIYPQNQSTKIIYVVVLLL